MRRLLSLLPFALALLLLWFYRDPLLGLARRAGSELVPCFAPIPYVIKDVDPRFGISREEFLAEVQSAEKIWEDESGRDLFDHHDSPTPGALEINLIYDERQADTDRLKALGLALDTSEKAYAALSEKYDSLKSEYEGDKAALEKMVTDYNKAKATYESKVSYWNARGGASGKTYTALEAERRSLNTQASRIKAAEEDLNTLAADVNALVVALNRIANELNRTAERYNTEHSGEFEEGIYESTIENRRVDIYQFENRTKLIRVLAHELGHALGLGHVEDTEAIMYRLNQGQAGALSGGDKTALREHCGILKD